MKTLVLHVGLHKTGTTFLQKTLRDNRALLREHDIDLAAGFDPERGDHHRLTRALRRENQPAEVFQAIDETEATTAILSSETLMPWLLSSAAAEDFAARLKAAYLPRVVIYLRRQDFLKESVFAEVACKWYLGSILDEDHYEYDFARTLGRLDALFGKDRLGVAVYRDDRPNALLADFLRCASIDIHAARFSTPEPQRVRMNRRKVMLLSQLDKRHHEGRVVVEAVRQSQGIADDGEKHLMSPAQRRAFLAGFLASNRAVSEEFALDCGDYLYDPAGISETWREPDPITVEEWTRLLLKVADHSRQTERERRRRKSRSDVEDQSARQLRGGQPECSEQSGRESGGTVPDRDSDNPSP